MEITVTNQQSSLAIDSDRLQTAVRRVLDDASFDDGSVDVAIVDDAKIQQLNCQYLDHDWATDVLSFVLELSDDRLVGQVVVSTDTAIARAAEFGWSPAEELLLYVIHGTLHLVGHRDKTDEDADNMREAETRYLAKMGVDRKASPAQHSISENYLSGGHLAL